MSMTMEQQAEKAVITGDVDFSCQFDLGMILTYEKVFAFSTENDTQDSPTAPDEQPDNTMNETKASASATPSTSGKRIQLEENDKKSTNEDNLPKKKRESAIRSGNNLKMLIQNKQLHYFPKQKVSPKKILSLRKRIESFETLISAEKCDKLEKLHTKTVAEDSDGSTVHDDAVATDDSDSNEPETIPDINRLEPVPQNEPNSTNSITTNLERSKTPLPETVDSDPTQISSTNNLDQHIESKTNFKEIQSSLNALQNRIHNLAPGNGAEHRNIVDIEQIEDIYNSVLEVKRKMNAVYQEKSVQLIKTFESINVFVPEIKKGLYLPTIQQLKENSLPNRDKSKPVCSQQEQPSQRKRPSSDARTPSLPQSESSLDSKSFSQSPKPSTSSKSKSKCSYVAK